MTGDGGIDEAIGDAFLRDGFRSGEADLESALEESSVSVSFLAIRFSMLTHASVSSSACRRRKESMVSKFSAPYFLTLFNTFLRQWIARASANGIASYEFWAGNANFARN